MKILIAIQYFYPYSSGGTEKYVFDLAKQLIKSNNQVAILKIGDEKDYYYENIKVFVLPEGNFSDELNDKEYEILNRFEEILKNFNPKIFHVNTLHEKLNAFFIKSAKKNNIICVFTSHLASNFCTRGTLLYMGTKQCNGLINDNICLKCTLSANGNFLKYFSNEILFLNQFLSIFIKNSSALRTLAYNKKQLSLLRDNIDLIFVQNSWQKEAFILNSFNKKIIINLPLPLPENSYISNTGNINKESNSLGFVGRYSPDKGIDIFINSLKKINNRLNIYFVLSINTSQIPDFEALISSLKDKHCIKIIYNGNQNQIIDVLDKISCLVVPSVVVETGPYVVLEALARKTPVIGSNIGGIVEWIKNGENGFLFEMGNEKSLIKTINLFLKNPVKIVNEDFIKKAYTIKNYSSKILKIYEQAINADKTA